MRFQAYYSNDEMPSPAIDSVLYEGGALQINVKDTNGLVVRIRVNNVVAYFVTDEGDRAKFIDRLARAVPRGPKALIYEVEKSDMLSWLNKEAFGIWSHMPRTHYTVVTTNVLVDFVTPGEP